MNYLVFFGNDDFKYKSLLLKREAESCGWFDEIIAHTPESVSEFLSQHQDFVRENKRGYGYWIWKPYIILDTLRQVNEGDIVTYIDSGGSILSHKKDKFDEYLSLLNSSERPIIAFGLYSQYLEKQFQKMTTLKRFGLDQDENFLNSGQIESGVIICKKNDFTVKFFEEWLALMLENNYSMIHDHDEMDQLDSFIENRHDQSVFSILCKSHQVNIVSINDCYGYGPFFSSRITDKGPRKFASDWCRMEPDFDAGKHWTWKIYLEDANVRNGVIDRIKSSISEIGKTLHYGNIDFDIKQEFTNQIIPIIDDIQTKKGLHKIELTINQSYSIAINKEKISGQFSCSFVDVSDVVSFNFEMTASGANFPESPTQYDIFFKSVYSKTWVGIYHK